MLDPTLVGRPDARLVPFEEYAEILAAAVASARPHGPYVLAVHGSLGLPPCWACAAALANRGETIARLVVLDAPRPPWRMGSDAVAFEKALQALQAPGQKASTLKWFSGKLASIGRSSSSLSPTAHRLPSAPAKLGRQLSGKMAARRESVTMVFEHFCAKPDAIWDFAIELALARGLPAIAASREALEKHEGAEDALDYVCKTAAKLDAALEVAHVRNLARCASDALAPAPRAVSAAAAPASSGDPPPRSVAAPAALACAAADPPSA